MDKLKRFRFLSAMDLKILAMILMLADHLWATIVPGSLWLTNIGRLACPIFAFQLAEGYFNTTDFKKYLKRMFLMALISEIPFNLMYGGSVIFPFHQNILFSFCISLLLMKLLDRAREKSKKRFYIAVPFVLLLGYVIGFLTMVDYFGFGILMALLFYLSHLIPYGKVLELLGMLYINGSLMMGMTLEYTLWGHRISFPQQGLAVLALIPIWMYNGSLGSHSKVLRTVTYFFYPVHILILASLALYMH